MPEMPMAAQPRDGEVPVQDTATIESIEATHTSSSTPSAITQHASTSVGPHRWTHLPLASSSALRRHRKIGF
uniref:Uncharacterized protein n=1 Tax=Solanum tuberosum TaxID=4113 RepID=M1DJY1_SOLTU